MIITTKLSYEHLELIKIFMEANELTGVIIRPADLEIRGIIHRVIELDSTDEDTSSKLTFMGLRHYGVLNMLDDFLLKCGVSPLNLNPSTIYKQEREEYEDILHAQFTQHFDSTKDEHTN